MSTIDLHVEPDRTRLFADVDVVDLPFGASSLARQITSDPPQPEDLTNAIGLVIDHLDDLARDVPALVRPEAVRLHGPAMSAIAAVELGSVTVPRAMTLSRAAAEDVFRTVATEHSADRRHNPGLPSEMLHDIVGACCLLVAVMRSLELDAVEVVNGAREGAG